MTGRGKGSKGIGQGGVKRQRGISHNIVGIPRSSIRRLARRRGVKRFSVMIYDE